MDANKPTSLTFRAGACEWRPHERKVLVRGTEAKLPRRVSECLAALLEADGEVVTRENLIARIWGNVMMDESNLAQTVTALRKAMDPAPAGGSHIETIPRIGYRMAVTVSREEDPLPVPPSVPTPTAWIRGALVVVALAILLASAWGVKNALAARTAVGEATRLVHDALGQMRQGTVKGFSQAAEKLRQAQAVAPDQPFWKAARAELAARAGVGGFGPALELARNAVAADADCLECRAILGYILVTREWNWAEGEKQLAMVIQSPGASSQARLWSAQLLNLRRRHPEAHRQLDLALSKDPTNARLHVMKGVTFYLQRNCDQAEVEMRQASSLDPGVVGPAYWMYRCAIFRDDPMQVAARWSTHYAVFGGFTNDHSHQYRGLLMETAQKGGKQGLARRLLLETSEVEAMRQHRYERAAWKLWVGDRAAALEELEAAVTARPFNLVYVAADPTLAQLRDQPRFRATLAQLRLAD